MEHEGQTSSIVNVSLDVIASGIGRFERLPLHLFRGLELYVNGGERSSNAMEEKRRTPPSIVCLNELMQ